MAEGIPMVNSVGFAENASMELLEELDVMKKKSEVFDGFQDHEAVGFISDNEHLSVC